MWAVAESIMLIFLGISAVWDIRVKKVPSGYLLAGTAGVVVYQAFTEQQEWHLWVLGMGIGCMFLMLSKYTEEGIGYGDSWMILNLGIFLGFWRLSVALILTFLILASVAAIGSCCRKMNRKTRIAFLPFLTIGYVGALLW